MAASGKRGRGPGETKSASGCPICGRPVNRGGPAAASAEPDGGAREADPFPFCSSRCQLVDLGRWLGEEYRVPDRDTLVWPPPDDSDGS